MAELLHINADDVDFTVTTGRSVPSFLYGTRTLPEDVWGIPSFILDSTALRVNEHTQEVEQTPGQEFVYGGSDGRDLVARSTPLPRGGFSFTRTDLDVSRTEEELPDGTTLRKTEKTFDVEGTLRRVTGDASFQAVLGPEHLGTIVPGRDVKVGEHILLGIWGMKVEVRVSGYEHTSKGYSMTIESLHTNNSKSVTNSVTTVSEKIEVLSRKMREIEDTQSAYSPADWSSEPAGSGGSGEQGPPGDTPYIHPETGTWWVGPVNTYVQAQGPEGPQGPPGPPGEGSSGPPLLLTQKIDQNKNSTGNEILEYTGTSSAAISTTDGNIDYHRYDFQFPSSLYGEYPNGLVTLNASYLGNNDNLGSLANISFYLSSGRPRITDYTSSSTGDFRIGASSSTRNLYLFVDKSKVRENYGTTRIPEINVTFMPVTLPTG